MASEAAAQPAGSRPDADPAAATGRAATSGGFTTALFGLIERTGHWGKPPRLSSGLERCDRFLEDRAFERAPWLAVGFAGGVAAWITLPDPWHWCALLAICGAVAAGAAMLRADGDLPHLRMTVMATALMVAAGCATIWIKSALVGTPPLPRPGISWLAGTIITRDDQGAQERVRLLIEARIAGQPAPMRLRLNMPDKLDSALLGEGAIVRLRARLMPPASPMLPGGYDFARTAWFEGLGATGTVLSAPQVVRPARDGSLLRRWQATLSAHVRANLSGTPGTIAAAFASGDRGSISKSDEAAMRDAGLTHLLSVSGLHVSAVIGGAYLLAIRLLALWPWLALRVRLPLVASAMGAGAGLLYTLLTGAEVPTVRSCVGALLVLGALALGRDPLSLRLLAVAALFVMIFWPEAVFGPSFQMSFASVLAIVSLHSAAPVRRFLAFREEARSVRLARHVVMLFVTGAVIELALMPIGLFHFRRAGIYGPLTNVLAIPLTTFASMPLIALGLALDLVGAGGPAWWLAGKSLQLLLWLAHFAASQPGAVVRLPGLGAGAFALFIAGSLWLALWTGRIRLWGLLPVVIGTASLALLRTPDVLVSGDGLHVGITGEGPELLVLRQGRSSFTTDNLLETAGMSGEVRAIDEWPGADCNPDLCRIAITRGGRRFALLMTRGRDLIDRDLIEQACAEADIVISDRRLPPRCHPRLLKADRALLARTGGLAINLERRTIMTVAETQGHHGWYRWPQPHRFTTWPPGARYQPSLRPSASDTGAAAPPACPGPALRPDDRTADRKPNWRDRAAPCRSRGAGT